MSDLIKFENGKLGQQAVEYITAIETQMKALKEQYDAFKDELLNAMEQNGIVKFESETVRVNYIAETTRETFDSKQFKADMPDLYNEYVKFSKVKPSIRIKVEQ
jgi:regulator of replication initiation timing